ncbi:hypothetical protein PCI56_09560 [Plesiomonas shigelloides subsp. oncorhynchi]|nr:hypothetical protein [Plesiomonas shigelloides]
MTAAISASADALPKIRAEVLSTSALTTPLTASSAASFGHAAAAG